jgi:hypothetical protein
MQGNTYRYFYVFYDIFLLSSINKLNKLNKNKNNILHSSLVTPLKTIKAGALSE